MVGPRLRRVRWSGTASALAGVVALLGASVLVSAVLAARQPDGGGPSSTAAASLAAVTSTATRPTTTTALVATTLVERRARPTKTTTPPTTTTTIAATPPSGLLHPTATATDVWFTAVSDDGDGDPCTGSELWRVARAHPEANVAVSSDGLRLEEVDPATGAVTSVLATWIDEVGRPEGSGLVDVGGGALPTVSPDGTTLAFVRGVGCGPEVVLRDLVTGSERVLSDERVASPTVTALRWTPDGAALEVVATG